MIIVIISYLPIIFIAEGAKVNTKDNSWLTALHYCAARGHEVRMCICVPYVISSITYSILIIE